MAWVTPYTFVNSDVLYASQLNSQIRDNMNELTTAKAAQRGSYFVSTAANAVTERKITTGYIDYENILSSTTYAILGPSETVTHGGSFIAFFGARLSHQDGTGDTLVSPQTTLTAASDTNCIRARTDLANFVRPSSYRLFTETAGTTVCSLYYRTSSLTSKIAQRSLILMPF